MNSNGGAIVRSHFEGGVGIVRVSGPVTLETMRGLRAEIFRAVVIAETSRVLCDLSAAIVLMDDGDWNLFSAESEHLVDVPTGYLVGSEALRLAFDHCDRMNARGRICLAFMTSSSAYSWVGLARPKRLPLVHPQVETLQ